MASIGIIVELERSYNESLSAVQSFPRGFVEVKKVSSYEDGIAAAKRMVSNNIVVLVTRAGYISKLRDADLDVPVIDIPFSMSNITQTCMDAHRLYGKVGMVGTQYVIEQAKALSSVLGSSLRFYEANVPPDYRIAAAQARVDGVDVLVGGYDETKYAEDEGLRKMIMASGREEITEALDEAMKIVSRIQTEAKKSEELNTLFDIIGDALIMFDFLGNVMQINRKACKALGVDRESQIGCRLANGKLDDSVMSVIQSGNDLTYDLQECGGAKYVCGIRAIVTKGHVSGAVAKLQSVEYVQSMERSTRTKLAERGLTATYSFDDILGTSPRLREAIDKAKRYSAVDSNVLITGESGTGKELFAQSIHNFSPRANCPFVAINCVTLPNNLLESELFGYSEGAFTGAKRSGKAGLFELAHNGTIFLDEIGEIDLAIQARLLRVVEEKRVMRLGDDKIIPVNVRIIAATNKDLHKMVLEGKFRSDLFFRLNVLDLWLPPMSERGDDVRMLIERFVRVQCDKIGRSPPVITPEAMELLLAHDWPGNAREISNMAERLVVSCPRRTVERDDIEKLMPRQFFAPAAFAEPRGKPAAAKQEPADVRYAMETCRGNKTAAAALLGVSRPTLYRMLRELDG